MYSHELAPALRSDNDYSASNSNPLVPPNVLHVVTPVDLQKIKCFMQEKLARRTDARGSKIAFRRRFSDLPLNEIQHNLRF
jgi:hypothetical protein